MPPGHLIVPRRYSMHARALRYIYIDAFAEWNGRLSQAFLRQTAFKMKAAIPGTAEHKAKSAEKAVQKDEKNLQKNEAKLDKHEAKAEAKDHKTLQKEEGKLQKQEEKAAQAADKAARH